MIRRRHFRFYKGELGDIVGLLLSGQFTHGVYTSIFEQQFANYIGTKHAIATCSGRNGLDLVLDAFHLQPGDEVITAAYTLKDLIYLIKQKKLVPKLVDIEEGSFNINPLLIEKAITAKTKVIIATHIFGLPCNIIAIMDIAKKYNIKVIEDCAHSLGAEFMNRKTGAVGDAAIFSFETLKLINTFGGGAITTNDTILAQVIREKISNYSSQGKKLFKKMLLNYVEHCLIQGPLYPLLTSLFMFKKTTAITTKLYLSVHHKARVAYSKFANVQALLGIKQLALLEKINAQRNAKAYALAKKLPQDIYWQVEEPHQKRICYFFVVILPIKEGLEKIRTTLLRQGIDTGIKEEITDNCSLITEERTTCPITEKIFSSALQLPLYDTIQEKDMGVIISKLKKYF